MRSVLKSGPEASVEPIVARKGLKQMDGVEKRAMGIVDEDI